MLCPVILNGFPVSVSNDICVHVVCICLSWRMYLLCRLYMKRSLYYLTLGLTCNIFFLADNLTILRTYK